MIKYSKEWVSPIMELPEGWKVKFLAPFGGAVIRFNLITPDEAFSVYLDVDDSLGCVGEPYWEIYSFRLMNTIRILYKDSEELLPKMIEMTGWDSY